MPASRAIFGLSVAAGWPRQSEACLARAREKGEQKSGDQPSSAILALSLLRLRRPDKLSGPPAQWATLDQGQ
jgi:hypothetical protein